LAKKLRWTKIAIFFERLWIKLWAPFIVISLFFILTLFHFWPLLSPLMHRLSLALFAMAFIASFYPLLSLRSPKDKEALKRLDEHSTLPHQPAQAFKDKLEPNLKTQSNKQTEAIWLHFKNRLVEKIRQLKVRPPQPETYKQDPYALRMVLMLAVACGLFFQGGNLKSLIANAVTLPPMINTSNLRVDAWVTPPSYTGKAPILIADGGKNAKVKTTTNSGKPGSKKNAFTVPQNSTLTIRINGSEAKHVEIESSNSLLKSQKLEPQSSSLKLTSGQTDKRKNTKEFHLKLTEEGPVKLTIDTIPLKDWRFEIIADNPPIIGLVELPAPAQSRALKLKYRVADDYGVLEAKAHLKEIFNKEKSDTSVVSKKDRPLGSPMEYPLNLKEQGTKSSEGTTFKDLTDHPWAGLPITLYLSAKDEGENLSNSPEINIVLPEYQFTKPIAKNIIRLRKQLIMTPSESPLLSQLLHTLLNNKKPFEKDLTLYLGLKVTAARLETARTRKEKEALSKLLYQLARHAEDGDLSAAERELRTAQEELRKALQDNAPNQEIQKRIDNLRKALQKYMQALAKQQQKQNQQAQNEQQNQKQNSKNISPEDFEQMLKTIEELSKSGAKDLARQMLSQLQNMLENLQTGKKQNQQQQNKAAKNLEELGKILQEQQKLMDKTFEQNRQQNRRNADRNQQQRQNQQPGNQNQRQNGQPNGAQELDKQQQALRQQLQKLMRELEKSRQGQERPGQGNKRANGAPLENADRAMQRAEELLKRKELGNALSQEGQALDQLRKGIQQMAKEMQGMSGNGGSQKRSGKDPLGRPQSTKGMDTSESTKVPDKIDIQRAREILRNLQEKLSDPNRPAPEIDYIERLIKRF
jgi:uncharacterized protein (TIGR02302 family)